MRIGWGWRVTVLISSFVVMIISMAVMASQQTIELVEEDYYVEELAYEKQIQRLKRAKALPQGVTVLKISQEELSISIPDHKDKATGKVVLIRPANMKLDIEKELNLNEKGEQIISLSSFAGGLWEVQVKWTHDNEEYFHKETITI